MKKLIALCCAIIAPSAFAVDDYRATINEEGPLTADNSIIEKHLNKLASDLLLRSLSDPEFEQVVGYVAPAAEGM